MQLTSPRRDSSESVMVHVPSTREARAVASPAPHEATLRAALDVLRRETGAIHRRLDALPCFEPLLSGRLTADAYAALLQRFLVVHEPIGAALEALEEGGSYTRIARPYAALIRDDLADLGHAPPPLPAVMPFAFETTPAFVAGTLYVIDGSTLGGKVLRRMVPEGLPRRFFAAGSDGGTPYWRMCCDFVAARVQMGDDVAEMAAAARTVFLVFEEALCDGASNGTA